MDATTVDAKYYTAISGSTVVTLTNEYLETLSKGAHTVTFVYTDGTIDATLTVANASTTPDTSSTDDSSSTTPGTNTTNNGSNTITNTNTTSEANTTISDNNSDTSTTNTSTSTSTTTTNTTPTSISSPKTGDNIILWICIMAVSGLGLILIVKLIRKRDK